MKRRVYSKVLENLFIVITIAAILITCKKPEREMMVSTAAATNITSGSADVSGNIIDLGEGVLQHGHCYSKAQHPTIADSKTQLGTPLSTGNFTSQLTSLDPGTKYFVRAYLFNGKESVYGEEINFTTLQVSPAFISAVVENATPTILEMTYSLTLANVVPDVSAFTVIVNSASKSVSSVAISGSKVQLTLSSAVAYGDVVTVAYTKPAANPLQTSLGGQAASITAQSVINNVAAAVPVLVSASVENAAPTILEMTYSLTLDNSSIPAASAFTVMINSVARSVNSVAIAGAKVQLTLASAVVYGDVVTVAYTKPATNMLKTTSGGEAVSITAQSVTNNVAALVPVYVSSVVESTAPAILEMTYSLTLDNNSVPAASAFTVIVNSTARSVNSVAITGAKVQLTLAGEIVYGDVVTVAYTKPATNMLKTTSGGEAVSITAQSVTNNVAALVPVYVSSVVESAAPAILEMTYSLTLDNSSVPTASAFTVIVNSTARSVNSVAITGAKVQLTLASEIVYGDVVTVAYTKPATNPLKTSSGGEAVSITAQSVTINITPITVTDYDGNIYNVLTIGTQDWLQKNLVSTHYNNGDAITNVTDNTGWGALTSEAYCWYNNDEATYRATYGALYNWYAAVDVRNVCPAGWHVPTDTEWTTLTDYLGGVSVTGGKLKETGTIHWKSPNTGATNETGFTALPGGKRENDGIYNNITYGGYWWSLTSYSSTSAWFRGIGFDLNSIGRNNYPIKSAFSVRCLKGELPLTETTTATAIASTSVTLNGKVNANGASATVTFEYGTTTSYGSTATAIQSPATGSVPVNVSADITGLSDNTTYHFRVKAVNSGGTVYGDDIEFITGAAPVAPSATTGTASSVSSTSALLNGTVNANDLSTTVTFEYGPTTGYGMTADADMSPVTGSSDTPVSADITGLDAGTTYHYRLKAVSAGGTTYGDDMTFSTPVTISDADGNIYNTVVIGTQTWMQENLKTTKYNDGTSITLVTDGTAWSNLTTPGFCWYNNDAATYKNTYGALYNWYAAVDVRNVCPAGWHVPTDAEWTTLTTYLGGISAAGGKLKETGTTHWASPNEGATNETGFTALPGGNRYFNGAYEYVGSIGDWWSSTGVDATIALSRGMYHHIGSVTVDNHDKRIGFSVRCLEGNLALAETSAATAVASTSVTLNGKVNPNGASTTVTFEYGTSTSYGTTVTALQSPVTGSTNTAVSANITGLTAGTEYHFRIKVVSSGGMGYGDDLTFTTLPLPVASTGDATAVASASATLNGTVNANDLSTTVTFEYGESTSYGSEVTADQSPVTGSIETPVSKNISGLSASTTYHFRVKAVSAGGTTYGDDMEFTTSAALPTVTDYEGNVYNIVTIGTQDWLQQNLKTTKYNDGTSVPLVTDAVTWDGLTTSAYCWYDNNEATYGDTYGALYNWYTTVDVRNLCPAGWHVPTDAEWTILTNYLGGESIAGGKLKEIGTTHWSSPNREATNESGFTAMPSGYRMHNGTFIDDFGYNGYWWSSTESYSLPNVWYRRMNYDYSNIYSNDGNKNYGFSVRCLKGELPLTQTGSPTAVASTSVTLNGKVNPNGESTTVTFEYGTSTSYGSEVTADQSPVSGTTPVDVSVGLSGLTPGTEYHYRVKAVNAGGTSYGSDGTFTTPAQVTDIDLNTYNTVQIGTQTWMAENLKTTHYSDGSSLIDGTTAGNIVGDYSTKYWFVYGNNPDNKDAYGLLYTYAAIMNGSLPSSSVPSGVQGVCPVNWHVPSSGEWGTLIEYLGGATVAGGKIKEEGIIHWDSPNTDATNISGFSAYGAGYREYDGSFWVMKIATYFLTTNSSTADRSEYYFINNTQGNILGSTGHSDRGYSVRCVKD